MSYVGSGIGTVIADGQFDSNDNRYLTNVSAYLFDTVNEVNIEVAAVTLTVTDSEDQDQYLLTVLSTPSIEIDAAFVYSVDQIDVSDFPSGDITLTWTFEVDSTDYTYTQTVSFEQAPPMVFISGQTATLQDNYIVLDQAKTFTVRISDSLGNPIDGYSAELVIWDKSNATSTEIAAELSSAGSGLWTAAYTPSSSTFNGGLDRYEIYWLVKITEGSAWTEVYGSRQSVVTYLPSSGISTGPICYNTNQSLREAFPGVDNFLSQLAVTQGEREILLNRKRLEASSIIETKIRNHHKKINRYALELLANYETYRLILLSAHSFAKFAVKDSQLAEMNKAIARLYSSLFGNISTIRIGARAYNGFTRRGII
jgi:hypothetical protein